MQLNEITAEIFSVLNSIMNIFSAVLIPIPKKWR